MDLYNNDYNRKEDNMLWHLHELRHRIAKQFITPHHINESARDIIKKYNLENIKIIEHEKYKNIPSKKES